MLSRLRAAPRMEPFVGELIAERLTERA